MSSEASTKTVIGSFGEVVSADGSIVLEIDTTMHLDSDGSVQSSFAPQEGVYFLLHYDSSKVKINKVINTDSGDVQRLGRVSRSRAEEVTFTHAAMQKTLLHTPNSVPTARWYGRSSGLVLEGKNVSAPGAPCLGELLYVFSAMQYLHRPPRDLELDSADEWLTDIVVEYEAV